MGLYYKMVNGSIENWVSSTTVSTKTPKEPPDVDWTSSELHSL